MIELLRKTRKIVQSIADTLLADDAKATAVGYGIILLSAIFLVSLVS